MRDGAQRQRDETAYGGAVDVRLERLSFAQRVRANMPCDPQELAIDDAVLRYALASLRLSRGLPAMLGDNVVALPLGACKMED